MYRSLSKMLDRLSAVLSKNGRDEEHERLSGVLCECIDACLVAIKMMAADSKFAAQYCEICAEICEWCAQQCAAHDHEHCQQCAESCRECAAACLKMAA